MTNQGKFYGWKLLAVLWLILVMNLAFPLYGGSVINAYMAADLHLDRSTLGFGFGIFQLMIGLPGPLVALCLNKKGVRFTLRAGALLGMAGALLMALLVRTGAQFVVVFGLIIGAAAITAGPLPTQSSIARWFDKRRALAISLLLSGPAVGGFLAPPVLERVIAHYHGNWRAGWWLICGLSTIASLLATLFVRERPSDLGQFPDGESGPVNPSPGARSPAKRRVYRTSEDWTVAEVMRSPSWWMLLVATLGLSAGYTTFLAHGVIHLRDLGYTPGQAAFSYSIVLLALLAGNLIVAAVGDYVEPRFLWTLASSAYAIGMLLVLHATGTAGLYEYAVFLGLGFGIAFPTMMMLPGNYFGPKAYPLVVGLMMVVATAAGAIGASVAGYAYDHSGSYTHVFTGVAMLCFLGAVVALFMTPPTRKTAPPEARVQPDTGATPAN